MLILFTLIIVTLAVGYLYINRRFNYWKSEGVHQYNHMFRDTFNIILRRVSFTEELTRLYNATGEWRYLRFYQTFTPTLLVKDVNLLKQITVKDFEHFQDHRDLIPKNADPFWDKILLSLKGQRWHDMRATLSPSFTSSKMKSMFIFMSECSVNFVNYFSGMEEDIITVELRDVFTRYTNDVIASTAFGVKCDSLTNKNNDFYVMGKKLNFSDKWQMWKIFLYMVAPVVGKLLRIPLFPREVTKFFVNIVKETIAFREKGGIVRPDMLHLLMEARKNVHKYEEDKSTMNAGFASMQETEMGKLKTTKHLKLTDEDIAALAIQFFFAGFDSTSNLMCFMGYELGANPEVQDKLRKEILTASIKCNGKITYEALLKMKYLDMVISETLRKWPAAIIMDRIVTKPCIIKSTSQNEPDLHLKEGVVIIIPLYDFHHDEKYFPSPEVFDPERFSDENKKNINQYAYMPFGLGPRNCIGSRFALLETKVLFFHLLSKFEIVPVEKTQIPIRVSNSAVNPTAEDGFWFGLRRRK